MAPAFNPIGILFVAAAVTLGASAVASAPRIPFAFASPANVSFVRTLFSDTVHGFRDPTAPVFDGKYWHVWATKVRGTEGGYGGVVWHLYSGALDAPWEDGGIAVNRSSGFVWEGGSSWDSCGVFTPSVAWEGAGGAVVPAPLATTWFLFFGGVSHPQGPIFDESIGIATARVKLFAAFPPFRRSSSTGSTHYYRLLAQLITIVY
jgi:hypothetical protein